MYLASYPPPISVRAAAPPPRSSLPNFPPFDPNSDRLFNLGLCRVRDVLDPIAIVLYGRRLKGPFDGPPILFYQNSHYTGDGCSYLNTEQLQLIKEA